MRSPAEKDWPRDVFADALTDPALPEPDYLAANHGGRTAMRFNVYRNNVAHSMIEALGQTFAAVRNLAGADRFAHVARLFISAHPPRSPLLFEYGREFAGFLDEFPPARQQMPWLADIARFERAWLDAWHAADALPLEAAVLAQIAPEALASIRLAPHPASAVVTSQWPVLALWEAARTGAPEISAEPSWSAVLVTRPHLAVITTALSEPEALMTQALLSGIRFDNAVEIAFAEDRNFDLSTALAKLMASGAFAHLKDQPETKTEKGEHP